MPDLDQGGNYTQRQRVNLGPTLGWQMQQVKPEKFVTSSGTTTLTAGDSLVLVNVAGLVTIQLPDVVQWLKQNFDIQRTATERAIWIKDLGGNAAAFNITVTPSGTQKIDNQAISFTIVQNRQLLRLYPLNDLTGWFSG